VLARGERDAGTLLLVLTDRGALSTVYERMPQTDGTRKWSLSRAQDDPDPQAFGAYLERRRAQDPDLWIVELDIPSPERFIANLPEGD